MACSISSTPSTSMLGRDWGKPNMKMDEKKSKAPQRRKPPHHAPIQRGSSGVMFSAAEKSKYRMVNKYIA